MDAETRAAALVARALDIQGTVLPTDTVSTLAAWDSMGHTRIVLDLEAETGRTLSAEEIASIESVAAVARLLG